MGNLPCPLSFLGFAVRWALIYEMESPPTFQCEVFCQSSLHGTEPCYCHWIYVSRGTIGGVEVFEGGGGGGGDGGNGDGDYSGWW